MSTSEEEDCVKRLLVELADASRTVIIASSTGDRITGKGTLSTWTKEAVITSSHTGQNKPIWTAQRSNTKLRNSVVSIKSPQHNSCIYRNICLIWDCLTLEIGPMLSRNISQQLLHITCHMNGSRNIPVYVVSLASSAYPPARSAINMKMSMRH